MIVYLFETEILAAYDFGEEDDGWSVACEVDPDVVSRWKKVLEECEKVRNEMAEVYEEFADGVQ
jgi:hypothetical protein